MSISVQGLWETAVVGGMYPPAFHLRVEIYCLIALTISLDDRWDAMREPTRKHEASKWDVEFPDDFLQRLLNATELGRRQTKVVQSVSYLYRVMEIPTLT